jgi:hypothetical protein
VNVVTSASVKSAALASNPVRLISSAQKRSPFKFFNAMNGMFTCGIPLGGFLATDVDIEFNSDSVASNKSFGVTNPWAIRYRVVWALNPQSSRAPSMVVDLVS